MPNSSCHSDVLRGVGFWGAGVEPGGRVAALAGVGALGVVEGVMPNGAIGGVAPDGAVTGLGAGAGIRAQASSKTGIVISNNGCPNCLSIFLALLSSLAKHGFSGSLNLIQIWFMAHMTKS